MKTRAEKSALFYESEDIEMKELRVNINHGCLFILNMNRNKNNGADRLEFLDILNSNGIEYSAKSTSMIKVMAYANHDVATVLEILKQHYTLNIRG